MNSEKVTCAVCGKQMSTINNKHLASHGLTAGEYRERYPESPLLSAASARKLSERSQRSNEDRKGVPRSQEVRDAIRAGILNSEARQAAKGRKLGPMSDERKAKLSASHKAGFAEGRRVGRTGAVLSAETKSKISARLKGRVVGPEAARKAIATKQERGYDLAPFRGRSHSVETKALLGKKSTAFFDAERETTRAPMLGRIANSGLTLLNEITAPLFELRCNTCSHEFTRTPQMFQPSKWVAEVCDQCHPISPVSLQENEVADYVARTRPDVRVVRSAMDVIPPLEIDIYLPELKLAIEYCGLYWHSEEAGKKRWYHRHKFEACQSIGVRLITIFEDEWVNKRDVVESMLSNALHGTSDKIGARSCDLRAIDSSEANLFLNEHHVQGSGRSNRRYGLYHADQLVSVMTFSDSGPSRKLDGWEINRFASKTGLTVPGAASRLFRAFCTDVKPHKVVSYADLRFGEGRVYGTLGFEMTGHSVPNYWYIPPGELRRIHRFALRKDATTPAGLTERQWRAQQGYKTIWDCGHARWIWHPK